MLTTLAEADGVWEVAAAPHIRALAAPFGATIRPLRYTISDGGRRLLSDVRWTAPYGSGWLSTEGRLELTSSSEVSLLFDSFWTGSDGETPRVSPFLAGGQPSAWDTAVNSVGRLAFFEGLSRFPVRFLNKDLCVFSFPPLRTDIAAVRVTYR
jgi:hypothetical protein